jgi:hypothetical protein
MDIECEPVRWDKDSQLRKEIWGYPAVRSWVEDASKFADLPTKPPALKEEPMTLEKFLAAHAR